jgi:hypothetical protein
VHLDHLELVVVVIVLIVIAVAAVAVSIRSEVLRRAVLLDRDERQMQVAIPAAPRT